MTDNIVHATLDDYFDIIEDRPRKLTDAEVGYTQAPDGSAMRCCACRHYFRRAIDGHSVCEIFRSPEVDEDGVAPDYRCQFWNTDGTQFPLLPKDDN